ncbi:MAG: hypothetical protein Q9178_002340 [Gyalolechia marmorata]
MDCQVESLNWLLDQSFAHDLKGMRNLEGETPLEALEASLEEHRIKLRYRMLTVPISDKYDGVRHEELLCLMKLKGINPTSALQVDRVRFRCTCGGCLGGFLSPRVAFALECQGDIYDQAMDPECGDDQDGAAWCGHWDEQLGHVRPDVVVNMSTNKSYRQGFCNLFGYVAQCLRAKRVPTTTNVLDFVSEWPPVVSNYIKRGGTVAAVVLACYDTAIEQDKNFGDGFHEYLSSEDIEKLPRCRNDGEFAFSRRQYRRIEGLKGDPTYERGSPTPMTGARLMRAIRYGGVSNLLCALDE